MRAHRSGATAVARKVASDGSAPRRWSQNDLDAIKSGYPNTDTSSLADGDLAFGATEAVVPLVLAAIVVLAVVFVVVRRKGLPADRRYGSRARARRDTWD